MLDELRASSLLGTAALVGAAVLSYFIVRSVVLPLARIVARHTSFEWDDILLDRKVLHRLAVLVPVLVLRAGPGLLDVSPGWEDALGRVVDAFLVVLNLWVISAILRAVNSLYETKEISRSRPIKGYLQVVMILASVFGAVLIVARLTGQQVGPLLAGLGALTAVLLLIFKDSILSLVASVQLTQNDMLRVGDWIEMPSLGVDGDVIDVALHTVKVQNWDKTISTIPTHRLVSDSYRNWRGMSESGGRRIKRSLVIDMSTVRFLTQDEIEHWSRFEPLRDYMREKAADLEQANREVEDADGDPRRLTNIGTFRAYVRFYLLDHPRLATDHMTHLVRQRQPTSQGLPIEIYVFTGTTEWVAYEDIQADVFDHLIAMIPEFGLRVFQTPSGHDVQTLAGSVQTPS